MRHVLMHTDHRMNFEDRLRVFRDTASVVMETHMHCEIHGRSCELKRADIHVSGTPCVAWSSQGLRVGASGASALSFFSWIGQRRLIQERGILHENVPDFPVSLLVTCLSDLYIVGEDTSVVINSTEQGQPAERARRLSWLRHKSTQFANPRHIGWPAFSKLFRRDCRIDWSHYFVASKAELDEELRWARPSSTYHVEGGVGDSSFEQALNSNERAWLRRYEELCPCGVVNLEQHPDLHTQHNSGKPSLQTVIRKCSLMMSTVHRRWLLSKELLLTLNLPVYEQYAMLGARCSFNAVRADLGFPPRRRSAMHSQAGNAMSIPVMTTCLLWWIAGHAFPLKHREGEGVDMLKEMRLCLSRYAARESQEEEPEEPRARKAQKTKR